MHFLGSSNLHYAHIVPQGIRHTRFYGHFGFFLQFFHDIVRLFKAVIGGTAPGAVAFFAQFPTSGTFDAAIAAIVFGFASQNFGGFDVHFAALVTFLAPSDWIVAVDKRLFAAGSNGPTPRLSAQRSATNVPFTSHFTKEKVERIPRSIKASFVFLNYRVAVVKALDSLGVILNNRSWVN